MNKLKFLSNQEDIDFQNDSIYVTFSRNTYLKFQDNPRLIYFFDIPHSVNEREINASIEQNLFVESKVSSNEFYPLTFKYIYKYFLTYTQFYNRLENLVSKYKEISHIEYSKNISFIFTSAISAICKKYKKVELSVDETFDGFSYRHNNIMLSDVPFKIDNHNFYILLYAIYLRLFNHKVFILPSSFMIDFPKQINILKSSIFTVHDRLKKQLGLLKPSKYPLGLNSLDFSKISKNIYKLDKKIWEKYREDERHIIEHLISAFFSQYPYDYLTRLRLKVEKLFRWSNTKCVILDETIDAYRRLILSACANEKIDVEFVPHGIISEKIQFPFTKNDDYNHRYIPKILAWNDYSSRHFEKMKLESLPISFPISISPYKRSEPKDILVLLSYGDRVNLNQFEEDIIKILNSVDYKNTKIDWKIHHNIFSDSNNIMYKQKKRIEQKFNTNINFIDHQVKSSSIMKNYNIVIFTTYTTGIYEAALLNVPFIIYSNENEECQGIQVEFIPIAKNENDFRNLLKQDNNDYLVDIRKSLTKNITLNKYLLNKCA